jgi:ATP-dependent Clp protease ATP-binding subunit ClpC
LGKQDIQEIVKLELDKVADRLRDHDISLVATPMALEKLAEMGFDPEMGARPLKRVIQQKVEDVLSDALLSGTFSDGDTIVVDYREDEVVLRRAEGAPTLAVAEQEGA